MHVFRKSFELLSGILRPGNDSREDEKRILVLGAFIGMIFFLFVPMQELTDSQSYLKAADYFSGSGEIGEYLESSHRTPGYPLILLLTGTTLSSTFTGVKILQILMAVLIPLLIYRSALYFNRTVAYYSGLTAVCSFWPFAFANVVCTETSYIFFLLLSVYLCTRYLESPGKRDLVFLTLSVWFMTMVRPGMIFALFFLAPAVSPRRKASHLVPAFCCLLLLFAGWSAIRTGITGLPFSVIDHTNMSGRLSFDNIYLHRQAPFTGTGGPASARLIEVTRKYVIENFDNERLKEEAEKKFISGEARFLYYGRFTGNIPGFADNIFMYPTKPCRMIIRNAMISELGVAKSEMLYKKVFIERVKKHPGEVAEILAMGFIKYFLPVPVAPRDIDHVLSRNPEYGIPLTMSARLSGNNSTAISFLSVAAGTLFMVFRPLVALMMLPGLALVMRTSKWPGGLLIFSIVILHAVQVALFSSGLTRYTFHTIGLEIILAMLGTGYVGRWIISNRRLFSDTVE